MGYWDKYPERFRIIFLILLGSLAVISTIYFVRHATSATDENAYNNSYSKFFIKNEIPARVISFDSAHTYVGDSIPSGCAILYMKEKDIADSALFYKYLEPFKPNDTVNISYCDSKEGELVLYDAYVLRKYLIPENLDFVKKCVLIFDVEKGGASDRAGLKAGDILTKVNDSIIYDAYQADQMLRKLKSGKVVTYEVIRFGKKIVIPVKLAVIGIKLNILVYFLVGLINILLGGFVGWKRPNFPQTRLISLAILSLGFFNSTSYRYVMINFDWFTNLVILLNIGAYSFGIPALLHTGLYLPRENSEIVKRNWIPLVLYLIGAATFSIFILCLYKFNNSLVAVYSQLAMLALSILFVCIIWIYYRKSFKKSFKNTGWVFRVSLIFVLGGMLLFNIIRLVLFKNLSNFLSLRIETIDTISRYYPLIFLIIPAAYYYTIWKYRLFDIDFRVRKNIQYSLILLIFNIFWFSFLLVILYLITLIDFNLPNLHFTGSTIELIDHPIATEQNELYLRILVTVFSLAALWLFMFSRKHILLLFDRLFDRVKYDYAALAAELSPIFERALRESELSKTIVERLADKLRVSRVGLIIFKDNKTLRNQEFFGLKTDAFKDYIDLISIKLYEISSSFRGAFRAEYLPETMKDAFIKHKLGFIIPLRTKSRFLGIIVLGEKLSETQFSGDEIDFLKSIAHQAAMAVENAILYEDLARQERIRHELDLARKIQLASLPQKEPKIRGLEISAISVPAHEVGGDFFDYLNGNPNSVTVVIGDVSGKGTSAALHMSKTQGIMRTLYKGDLSPRELLVQTNSILFDEIEKSSFITAVAAKFDMESRRVSVARAGHLPVYHYQAETKKVAKLLPKGIVLGVCSETAFDKVIEEQTFPFNCNDIFVFVTDGVTESRNNNLDDFGEDRLIYLLEHSCKEPSDDIKTRIVDQVKIFTDGEKPFDDMTIVVVKVREI